MKKETSAAVLIGMLLLSTCFNMPLAFADYVVSYASFPPDLPGDVNNSGEVDLKDVFRTAIAFGSYPGYKNWDPCVDINCDGKIDLKDFFGVTMLFGKTYFTKSTLIAYSTSFEFQVPNDGNLNVSYYILVRFNITDALSGKTFYLVAGKSVDDAIGNVKIDCCLKSSQVGDLFNIELGQLSSGYHLLELEYLENIGGGLLNFTIKTANNEYAQMDRFRIYVPDYSSSQYEYNIITKTYYPYDQYFLIGYADDYIKSVWIDASEIWSDWEWNMGPNYGALYSARFCYPLDFRESWHSIKFIFGRKGGAGLLDFQYVSRSNQKAKIGNPKFWTNVSTSEASSYLKIYESKVWVGSRWLGDLATSPYMTDTTVRVLANATSDNPYYLSIPQEAQVSLMVYPLSLSWQEPINYVDIGVMINLTYTYYDENYMCYSMPIWFEPYSIEVKTPEQGSMLYIPQTSLVFCTQSTTSFVSPEWKIYLQTGARIACGLLGFLVGYDAKALVGNFWGGLIGTATGTTADIISDFYFEQDDQLNSTIEYAGTPSYRKFSMNAFKTTEQQLPLSPVVSNQSSVFFFRVYTWESLHCGSISIAMKGRLWLPFFYREPGHGPPGSPNWYGDWLPTNVKIEVRFPVFVEG
jgi:hypothetical protein